MKASTRLLLSLLWLAGMLGLAWLVQSRLQVSGDLRLFMPTPTTPEQRFLIDELGEGPGSRVLLLAIGGASPERLAELSRGLQRARVDGGPLAAALRAIGNGEDDLDAIPPALRPYRYLLSSTLDAHRLDAGFLRAQLQLRLQDLGSPAGALIEPLLPSDPTLETVQLAERWAPTRQPLKIDGVWFSDDGRQALLVAETRGAGFDPQGQRRTLQALRDTFAQLIADTDTTLGTESVEPNVVPAAGRASGTAPTLEISGPSAFSVLIGERTQREATRIGLVDTLGLLVLLAVAYRSPRILLLAPLPLATAGLAGLAAVGALFGEVHGITLAFGFTLIGVVQDYPVHLFSHQHAGLSPRDNVRALWPTLFTGVVSTCIAYLTFLVSGVTGLQQLSVFTIVGLAAAAASTRWLLPALIDPAPRDIAGSRPLQRLWDRIDALPRPRWSLAALCTIALGAAWLAPAPLWQNDLAALTPVPPQLLARDQQLREQLGAPDVRYLLTLQAGSTDALLAVQERLLPELDALVARGAIGGYDLAARYLPSAATQRRRQAALPAPDALRAALTQAAAGLPFKPGVFEPFLADVAQARGAPPLTAQALRDTPLASRLLGLLRPLPGGGARGVISLGGVRDVAALQAFVRDRARAVPIEAHGTPLAAARDGDSHGSQPAATDTIAPSATRAVPAGDAPGLGSSPTPASAARVPDRPATPTTSALSTANAPTKLALLDLKQASESLVTAYRERVLATLGVALALLSGAVWLSLRRPARVVRVLAPLLISTLLIVALLHLCAIPLSLFHLVALILAAGLGLDYALFFEHAGDDRAQQLRTLHAVLISSASTCLVFGLLATSSIPVLRAIGVTVALGVVFNFVLALLVSRTPAAPRADASPSAAY